MQAVRTESLVDMMQAGLPAMTAHTYDAAARDIANGCVAVYTAQLTDMLALHLQNEGDAMDGEDYVAQVVHGACQPFKVPAAPTPAAPPKSKSDPQQQRRRRRRRFKSAIKCPKCRSEHGVFGSDKIMRSVDEGAGRKFECLNPECGHAWTVK